jgi:hypothetical protein
VLLGYRERALSVGHKRTIFPPAVTQPMVFARAGYRIYNGDGTGTVIATTTENVKNLSIPIPGPTGEMFIAPSGDQIVVIETGQAQSDAFSSWRVGPE